MKIGDIVVQGTRLMKMHKNGQPFVPSKMKGLVVAVHKLPEALRSTRNGDWFKTLGGQTVDVFWDNGKLSENFAIQAGIGKVISSGGSLDSTFMESNLVWRFGTAGQ